MGYFLTFPCDLKTQCFCKDSFNERAPSSDQSQDMCPHTNDKGPPIMITHLGTFIDVNIWKEMQIRLYNCMAVNATFPSEAHQPFGWWVRAGSACLSVSGEWCRTIAWLTSHPSVLHFCRPPTQYSSECLFLVTRRGSSIVSNCS